MRESIKQAIYRGIDEFNLSQDKNHRLEKKEDEVLFSRAGFTKAGKLDSLSMVYLLVTIEEHLQKHLGNHFNLKVQELIDRKETELKDIETLINYIERL
jgi:hypothetical protein